MIEYDSEYHSKTLNQIAGVVQDYCYDGEMTTVDAVRLIEARMRRAEAELVIREIESKYDEPETKP